MAGEKRQRQQQQQKRRTVNLITILQNANREREKERKKCMLLQVSSCNNSLSILFQLPWIQLDSHRNIILLFLSFDFVEMSIQKITSGLTNQPTDNDNNIKA